MRIAFIVDKCAPFLNGGYERRMLEFARFASAHTGNEVRVYTSLSTPMYEDPSGCKFLRLLDLPGGTHGATSRNPVHGLNFSLKLLRNPFEHWDPDHVIVESIPYLHLLSIGRWARELSSQFWVSLEEVWVRYPYPNRLLSAPVTSSIRSSLIRSRKWAKSYLATSNATARAASTLGLGRAIHVLPSGVDVNGIGGLPSVEMGPQYDVASVGRLVSYKRHADLILALGELHRAYGWNGLAAIIGNGPELARLRALIRMQGLDGQVKLFPNCDDVTKYRILRQSRVFVLCSEREGQSLATLEAMTLGLPAIVATPEFEEVFGPAEYLEHGVNGYTFPVGCYRRLTPLIVRVLQDSSLRSRLSRRAALTAKRYDWQVVTREFIRILDGQPADIVR